MRYRKARAKSRQKRHIIVLITLLIAVAAVVKVFVFDGWQISPAAEGPAGNNAIRNETPVANAGSDADVGSAVSSAPKDWRLILVNSENPLPKDYTVEVRSLPNGLTFDARAYDSLMSMLDDGHAQGLSFVVCSAYRTSEFQNQLYEGQVAKQLKQGLSPDEAREAAKSIVAFPGTSEHQLGLAADIVALDYQLLNAGYAETPEAKWLAAHAHEYGFILRYPADKEDITKIVYEPWHFRYVGPEHALEIKNRGLCLEEYIAALRV